MVLTLTALAIMTKSGLASIYNRGVHGFTETLYAYDSQANNNGSAFAGYGADQLLGRVRRRSRCYLGRFVPLFAALALGGSLAQKKIVPASAGTFRTDGADVRRAARRRDRADRRPDDLPGAHPRPDRRGIDALMRSALELGRSRSSSSTAVFGFAYPLADDRLRPGRVQGQGERQPGRGRTARSSAPSSPRRSSRARATSTSARRRPRRPTTRAERASPTSARRTPTSPRTSRPRPRRS